MDDEKREVGPEARHATCSGNWVVFFFLNSFDFSLLNTIFRYYMNTAVEISDVGGCGR